MASSFPALGVTTPKFDSPLTTLGQLANLRGQQTENLLRQQQIQQSQVQTENIQAESNQRNRDQSDQNTFQQLTSNPDIAKKVYGGDLSPLYGKLQQKNIQALETSINASLDKKATLNTTQLAQEKTAHDSIGKTVESLTQMRNPDGTLDLDRVNQNLGSVVQQLSPELKVLNIDPSKIPQRINKESDLNDISANLGAASAHLDAAIKRKEDQGKIDLASAQAMDAAAKARESGVKAAKDQFELDLMKGATNGSQDAAIDQRFAGNPEAAQAAKDAFRSNIPAGVKAATDAVNKVYEDRVGEAAKAKSLVPGKVAEQAALLPGQVREAGARASAEIGPHIAQSVGTQKALAMQSPDAFAGIVDASARHSAENELDKTAKEYTDKLAASQQLLDTIHAAQAGNKAAPGVIPIEQVRSVLSNGRLNQAELKGVSSQAGSLMDRIEGWANKNTKGEPIPPDILRDTASLATIQQQAARRGYDAGIQRLKTRGVDVSKIAVPTISGGGGNIRARDPQGKLHEAPAGTALPAGWKLEP